MSAPTPDIPQQVDFDTITSRSLLQLPGAGRAAHRLVAKYGSLRNAIDSLQISGFTGASVADAVTPLIVDEVIAALPKRLARKPMVVAKIAGRIYGIAATLALIAVEAERAESWGATQEPEGR